MYKLLFGEESVVNVVAQSKVRVREIAERSTVSEFKTVRRGGSTETVLYPSPRSHSRRGNMSTGR